MAEQQQVTTETPSPAIEVSADGHTFLGISRPWNFPPRMVFPVAGGRVVITVSYEPDEPQD